MSHKSLVDRIWRHLTPAVAIALTPLLIIAVGLATPARALCDQHCQDRAYISTLDEFDVYYSSPAAAIKVGHSVCSAFDAGYSMNRVATIMLSVETDVPFSSDDVETVIGAAIGAYCPEHVDVIPTSQPTTPRNPIGGGVGGVFR